MPLPEKKSPIIFSEQYPGPNIEKRASRTMDLLGRTAGILMGLTFLPLKIPPVIRINKLETA